MFLSKTGKHTPKKRRDISPASMDLISGNTTEFNDFASCIDDGNNMQSIRKALEEPNILNEDMTMRSFNDDVFFDISIKNVDENGFHSSGKFNESKDILLDKARNFSPLNYDDDYRIEEAWRDGGFQFNDQEQIQKYRTALKTIVSSVGRQVITGRFNLANTSFPISCMAPISIL